MQGGHYDRHARHSARQAAPEHLVARADGDYRVDPARAKQAHEPRQDSQVELATDKMIEQWNFVGHHSAELAAVFEATNLGREACPVQLPHERDLQSFRAADIERGVDEHHSERIFVFSGDFGRSSFAGCFVGGTKTAA